MARTARPRGKTALGGTKRGTADAREELKRILERDTAVQGERAEETADAPRSPAGVDRPIRVRSSRTR